MGVHQPYAFSVQAVMINEVQDFVITRRCGRWERTHQPDDLLPVGEAAHGNFAGHKRMRQDLR